MQTLETYRPGSSRTALARLVTAIRDLGLQQSRVGFEVGRNERAAIWIAFYQAVRNELPEVEFVCCLDTVSKLWSIYSEAEIGCVGE